MRTFDVNLWWRDGHEFDGMFATVAIGEYDGGNDDGIFFWFADDAEYQDALVNGTEEFIIKEVAPYAGV